MANTTFRAGEITYNSTDFTTGNAILTHTWRDLAPFMDAPDRRDTPFMNSISKGSPVSQIKHEWGLRAVTPRGSTVGAGGIDNNAATTALPVASGHGIRFQQGHVLLVYASGTPGTYEIMWVTTSPAADTLTVKRPQGGTTALAWSAGAIIKIIGIGMPELTTYPIGPLTRGDLFYNYPQRFMTKVQVDLARENTPNYENKGSWIAQDAAARSADLKLDLERALIYGRRQLGSPDTSPKQPYLMSGALHFAELGGNIKDLSAALLTIEDIGDMGATLYDLVGTMGGKSMAMSNNTRRIFDRLLNNNRYATMSETKANLTWTSVTLSDGTYTFTSYPDIPDGTIMLYNKDYISYHPYKGMDWQETPRGQAETDGPFIERDILGQFTLEVRAPQTSGLITNFSTNLALYPTFN
jgi:hypothetical protein